MSDSFTRVCVFCGSSTGTRPSYVSAAEDLADELVLRGLGLVYGGGQIGLMGAIAKRVLAQGGEVIGVIPETLTQREVALEGASELHVVGSMHERKALMSELSSAFIALPGGFGTLEELFEVTTWAQLGIHEKPFGILDVEGFYQPLMTFLDRALEEGFIRPEYRRMLSYGTTPSELLATLDRWTPPPPIAWLEMPES